jgi:hypothetical protein
MTMKFRHRMQEYHGILAAIQSSSSSPADSLAVALNHDADHAKEWSKDHYS